jgi:hypothetical protein
VFQSTPKYTGIWRLSHYGARGECRRLKAAKSRTEQLLRRVAAIKSDKLQRNAAAEMPIKAAKHESLRPAKTRQDLALFEACACLLSNFSLYEGVVALQRNATPCGV